MSVTVAVVDTVAVTVADTVRDVGRDLRRDLRRLLVMSARVVVERVTASSVSVHTRRRSGAVADTLTRRGVGAS